MRMVWRIAWILLVIMIAWALFQGLPNDPNEWTHWASVKAGEFGSWFMDWLKSLDLGQYFNWDFKSTLESGSK